MSKYVILKKSFKPTYMGRGRYLSYTVFCHTTTKMKDNEPYWSLDLSKAKQYAVNKSQIDDLLKMAQNQVFNYDKVPYKATKDGYIFILKLNSPKLAYIMGIE